MASEVVVAVVCRNSASLHNFLFPQGEEERRQQFKVSVRRHGLRRLRRPQLHPPRRAMPRPNQQPTQSGLAVGRRFMEVVKQVDRRGRRRGCRQQTNDGRGRK